MAISVVNAFGANHTNGTSSYTVDWSADFTPTAGNTLLLTLHVGSTSTPPTTPPSGWTLIQSSSGDGLPFGIVSFIKVNCASTDTSVSIDGWSIGGATGRRSIIEFSGTPTSGALGPIAKGVEASGGTTVTTATTSGLSQGTGEKIAILGVDNGNNMDGAYSPGTWTEITTQNRTTSGGHEVFRQSISGTSGIDVTYSGYTSDQSWLAIFALYDVSASSSADLAATGGSGTFSGTASSPATATLGATGLSGTFAATASSPATATLAATGASGTFSATAQSVSSASLAATGNSGTFSASASSPANAALAATGESGTFAGSASTTTTATLAATGQSGTFAASASSPALFALAATGDSGIFVGSAFAQATATAAITGASGAFSGTASSPATASLDADGDSGTFAGSAGADSSAVLSATGGSGTFAGAAYIQASAALAATGGEGAFAGSAYPLTIAELAALGGSGTFAGSVSTQANADLDATGGAGTFAGSAWTVISASLAATGASGSFAGTAEGQIEEVIVYASIPAGAVPAMRSTRSGALSTGLRPDALSVNRRRN